MSTHILIEIKDWEAQRELYRNKLREIDKAKTAPSHEYYRLQGICSNMDSILAHQKQISLDEKDIEVDDWQFNTIFAELPEGRQSEANPRDTINKRSLRDKGFKYYSIGYKQALLDLK